MHGDSSKLLLNVSIEKFSFKFCFGTNSSPPRKVAPEPVAADSLLPAVLGGLQNVSKKIAHRN